MIHDAVQSLIPEGIIAELVCLGTGNLPHQLTTGGVDLGEAREGKRGYRARLKIQFANLDSTQFIDSVAGASGRAGRSGFEPYTPW